MKKKGEERRKERKMIVGKPQRAWE